MKINKLLDLRILAEWPSQSSKKGKNYAKYPFTHR